MRVSKIAYSILKQFPQISAKNEFVLAVSGGMDSICLLSVFHELYRKVGIHFTVAYIHHGYGSDTKQNTYRDSAKELVKTLCEQYEVVFESNSELPRDLSSEEEMRNFRYQELAKIAGSSRTLVFAQHRDDLFETRFLHLMRGTGPEGFVTSMPVSNQRILRPFLGSFRFEIEEYAKEFQLQYIQDPSNSESKYLRNWLRNEILPTFEQKRPGSYRNLLLSFERMAEGLCDKKSDWSDHMGESGIHRQNWVELNPHQQASLLVHYLHKINYYEFSSGQLEEVRKRLDNIQTELTFRVMQGLWSVNQNYIRFQIDNAGGR